MTKDGTGNLSESEVLSRMLECARQLTALATIETMTGQLMETAQKGKDYRALLECLAEECERVLTLGDKP